MLRTWPVVVALFLMNVIQTNDSVHALPSKRVPNLQQRSNSPFLSQAHHDRRQVKADWNYIIPQVSSSDPPRVPLPASSPSANSNRNTDSPISVAPRTPAASSSLSDQSNRINVEATDDGKTATKGISPIQIRPAILNMSMPFALSCLSISVILSFLVWRGSAAVSSNVRQILLTRSTFPDHKALQS